MKSLCHSAFLKTYTPIIKWCVTQTLKTITTICSHEKSTIWAGLSREGSSLLTALAEVGWCGDGESISKIAHSYGWQVSAGYCCLQLSWGWVLGPSVPVHMASPGGPLHSRLGFPRNMVAGFQKTGSRRSCRFLRPEPRIWLSLTEPRFEVSDLQCLSMGGVTNHFGGQFF